MQNFKPEVGCETELEVQVEDQSYLHLWRVTEVEPPRRLVYNRRYENYPGDSYIVFELYQK